MNHDLIKQLQSLSPTEGEWENEFEVIGIKNTFTMLYITEDSPPDDDKLITLAPTMRLEILAMAKEIEELRSQLSLALRVIKSLTP